MPLDSVTHSQTRPSHPRNSQLQNAATPSIQDSNSAKPGPQHPTSPILLETSTSTHSTLDHQRAASFHPLHYSEYIPDPHRPNPSLHLPEIYPPPDAVPVANSPSHHIKYFVAIDFGAVSSGVSYAASTSGDMHQILIPTCLVYDALGHVRAWGLEAKDLSLKRGWVQAVVKYEFSAKDCPGLQIASGGPPKNAVDVVADYLACLWMYMESQVHRENGLSSLSYAEVYLTVLSAWDLHVSLLLQEAAIKARLVVQHSESGDIYWQDRVHIILETEASVIHPFLSPAFKFHQEQVLTICDVGGATVIAEVTPRSGSYWGSLFLDLNFRKLVEACLAAHPVHLDEASLAHFNAVLDDPAVGLHNGELVIPGDVLRREVFDPIIKEVLHSIATHVQASHNQFGPSIGSIIRPADGDVALCRGGARFGIGSLVSSVIQPQNVFRHMVLVEYIVRRGAIVTKGSRSELRLRKFCSSQYDRTFDLVLYTSTGDQTRRYFDEEGGEELCRCRIDLETYPSFLEQFTHSSHRPYRLSIWPRIDASSNPYVILLKWCKDLNGAISSTSQLISPAPPSADMATVWEIEDFLSNRTRHGIQAQIAFVTPLPLETLRDLLLMPGNEHRRAEKILHVPAPTVRVKMGRKMYDDDENEAYVDKLIVFTVW
ncbi:hypothetical protein BS47DRAFT_1486686 [Hydnum rufescens UP504]|uniref:Actin-like ATPase domain-containing protein n=1 Tax=Hydnum rufescens UP504 TaxID=1448309 RepID=A0A9P6AU75_9AGAM|nr:hypothetical protein BS47DRAFT_1486686 [Hydnum rufescens UP504]